MEPAHKRQKTSVNAEHTSSLLKCSPEVLRNVYSFLNLKEALVVRHTCRQLADTANDIFRYSFIMDKIQQMRVNWNIQKRIICNPVSIDNLRAVLCNETLPLSFAHDFISYMVESDSQTDNGEEVSLLLQDSRCDAYIGMLVKALKKGYTSIAAALQEDERVKKDIQKCAKCSVGVACYECGNEEQCSAPTLDAAYCPTCVLVDESFCSDCGEYLCPSCADAGNLFSCEGCQVKACCAEFYCAESQFLHECRSCNRQKCGPCIHSDGEHWTMDYDRLGWFCPSCQHESKDKSTDELTDK